MRYELRFTAYDVMDQIQLAIVVQESPATEASTERRSVTRSGSLQGVGQDDALLWARDALVAALEIL